MKKLLKKISKLLKKVPNIRCEMILFLYPILSFYSVISFYSSRAIMIDSLKDLILFTFGWYANTIGLYIMSNLVIDRIFAIIDKIKNR